MKIPGKTFPVQVVYKPHPHIDLFSGSLDSGPSSTFVNNAVTEVVEIHNNAENVGDILVFLPSLEHTESAAASATKMLTKQGYRIFKPHVGSKDTATFLPNYPDIPFDVVNPAPNKTPKEGVPPEVLIIALHGGK